MIFINTFFFFSEKIRLDNLCESSARQRIHMKLQALFFKNKSKDIKLLSVAIFVGALRVKFLSLLQLAETRYRY